MGYVISENGDVTTYQGDDFHIVVKGLPTDQNYKLYFAIQNLENIPIGDEIMVESFNSSTVNFHILASLTDLLTVEEGEKFATYKYGIKKCSEIDFSEDTLLIGNKNFGEYNYIKVFPRKVKGTSNE